jgi:hypothetical protein
MNLKHTFDKAAAAWLAPLALATSALVLSACGGGGDAGTGAGAESPQTYSTGMISGFGSIIVNGVRFDDSSATVTDDDDNPHARSNLKLGMIVEVKAGAVDQLRSAATEIIVRSEIKGPVEAVDVAGNRLTVLGQDVRVSDDTVYEGAPNGLASIQTGDLLEVYALLDLVSGHYNAMRVEVKTSLDWYKLRGRVRDLDTAAKTFRIGGALISYAQIAAPEMASLALANGRPVRVKLSTTPQAGAWIALKLRSGLRHFEDRAAAELEGFVSDFVSLADFKVGGISVDASRPGLVVKNGSAADIANGVRIEVEGVAHNGVVIAREVEIKRPRLGDRLVFELHGPISSLDLAAQTFVLRGVRVHFSQLTEFRNGTSAKLAVGARVEVKGRLAAHGAVLEALRISFEN